MNAELTHDILARKIGEKVSSEEKQIRKMERFVRENYEHFLETGKKAFLTAESLDYLIPLLDKLLLTLEEKEFFERSRIRIKLKKIIIWASGLVFLLLLSLYFIDQRIHEIEKKMHETEKKIIELDYKKKQIEFEKLINEKELERLEKQKREYNEIIKQLENNERELLKKNHP